MARRQWTIKKGPEFMSKPRTLTLALAAIATLIFSAAAQAQGTSIGTVNPAKAFNEMQETKDLKQKLDAERSAFETEAKSRQQKVKDLQQQRDLLKSDSPQYADLDKQLLDAAIQFDTWTKITQAQAQRNQKVQMRNLFDKIIATASEVAAAKNID